MNKLRCIIVDDESIARKAIKEYVLKVETLEFVKEFRNGLEAKNWLKVNKIDLIFLDINMPYLSGIEMLKLVENQPQVIFTTAHAEHAIESFEFNVVDYLLKPISFEKFLKAVNKAMEYQAYKTKSATPALTFKSDGGYVKVKIEDINYIEAMQNYIRIVTSNERHMVLMSLKQVLEMLPTHEFVQSHRSYVVNFSKIDRIEKNEIIISEERIPISKRSKKEILERFRL